MHLLSFYQILYNTNHHSLQQHKECKRRVFKVQKARLFNGGAFLAISVRLCFSRWHCPILHCKYLWLKKVLVQLTLYHEKVKLEKKINHKSFVSDIKCQMLSGPHMDVPDI